MPIQTISTSTSPPPPPNDHFNFIIYDTISATPSSDPPPPPPPPPPDGDHSRVVVMPRCRVAAPAQGRKKRRRRPKVCKNKEEAETQRMTHITVERNRRKLMNEHLAVLRSFMPESYVQRGDQASIVGGAIEYVKELEHLLQSLEAQKFILHHQQVVDQGGNRPTFRVSEHVGAPVKDENGSALQPFAQFFTYPQYTWSQIANDNKYTSKCKASVADIEVTLIQSHANLRILSKRCHRQLYKLVNGFQALNLTILHLNLTTFDYLILYSISAKVEEGCHLTSADDIAAAVHHMLRLFEQENVSVSVSPSTSPLC